MNAVSRGIGSLVVRGMTGSASASGLAVDPQRFGIELNDPVCAERAGGILTSFFSGFEYGLKRHREVTEAARRTPALLLPFFHEGLAMACLPNGYLRWVTAKTTLERFELEHGESDPFVLMRYVGLGFWLGFQHARSPGKVEAFASRLHARKFGALIFDGYGFKTGFFGYRQLLRGDFSCLDVLRSFSGSCFASAMNGLGRSLWFFTMDRPQEGFALARKLGKDGLHVLGGMGLASAFTFPDQLSRAYAALALLTQVESPHFLKGIRIALYVRQHCDHEFLQKQIEDLPMESRTWASKDLERALQVGAQTRHKEGFIEAFHAGCLDA